MELQKSLLEAVLVVFRATIPHIPQIQVRLLDLSWRAKRFFDT